jgi:microcystin-dependent protein
MMFAAVIPPTGWLVCDGSAVNRTTYASLFAAISTVYGAGNGTTTFNLPDFRARTPRMDNPNIALAGGTAPAAHDHVIDGGATDAVAHVSFVTGPHPQIHMERISTASYNSNFDVDDTGSGSSLAVTANTSAHTNGAKVSGTTADNTVSPTATDLLNPFLNISFIIKT